MLEGSFSKVIMCVIVDFADIDQLEIGDEIFPKNEEDAISINLSIRINVIQILLLRRSQRCPEGFIIVTGSSFPFLVTPRISEFYHPLWVIIDAELNNGFVTMVQACPLTKPKSQIFISSPLVPQQSKAPALKLDNISPQSASCFYFVLLMGLQKTGAEEKACRTSSGSPPIIWAYDPQSLAQHFSNTMTQISFLAEG